MKISHRMLGVLGIWLTVSCSGARDKEVQSSSDARALPSSAAIDDDDDGDEDEGEEVDIPLGQLPPKVLAAAKARVPGFVPRSAEQETEDGTLLYSIAGTADGVSWEIEVTPDGKVLEVESGDDDDDDEE